MRIPVAAGVPAVLAAAAVVAGPAGAASGAVPEHGYLRDRDGRFTTVDLPGVRSTSPLGMNAPFGVNDGGRIVGSYAAAPGADQSSTSR